MSIHIRFQMIVTLVAFLVVPKQAQVRDFAPLKVGNTWIYMGSYIVSGGIPYGEGSVLRKIKVETREQTGDSVQYKIGIWDSIYGRIEIRDSLRDTVIAGEYTLIELPDSGGVMHWKERPYWQARDAGMLDYCFTNHSFPDSLLFEEFWNGEQRKEYGQGGMQGIYYNKAQNVGLIDYGKNESYTPYVKIDYELIQYGDIPVSIGRAFGNRKVVAARTGIFGRWLGSRNLLGRKSAGTPGDFPGR